MWSCRLYERALRLGFIARALTARVFSVDASSGSNGKARVPVGSVVLCVETFGSSADPAIMLIAGTSGPMDAWDAEFCGQLADGGRHVIRYDSRDTGGSTSYPPGEPPYGFDDFVSDAIGVLAVLGVAAVHLAGGSLGGAVCRAIALRQPERVRSLTLISSTPRGPGDPQDRDLPPPTAEFMEFVSTERPEPDWGDRDAYVDNYVVWDRVFAGPEYFDEDDSRDYAGRVFDRTVDIHAASVNHAASDPGTTLIRSRHAEITAPTLIIHGTADPLLPFGHAEALAREIAGARLLALDGVGHQLLPRAVWPTVVSAMLDHTGPR
jgi:pimeloyl-ACP methyl ester carboxylesterase